MWRCSNAARLSTRNVRREVWALVVPGRDQGPNLSGNSELHHAPDLVQPGDQTLHIVGGVVDRERGAGRGGRGEASHQEVRAVVPGPGADPLPPQGPPGCVAG